LTKDKSLWIIIGLIVLYLVMLLSVPRGEVSNEEKVKQWKPRDFYLVYKMWTDEEYRNVNGK
tara:strand:+ start:1821 stop:2006 length:186 start_codon:yes stop_codon:yes gene_type:complete